MSNSPFGFGGGNAPGGNGGGYGNPYGAQTVSKAPAGAAPAPAPGADAGDLVKDTTTAKFSADVLQESRRQPVLVDFWAPWCGPCRQLTPILEKAVRAAGGRVKLVKMNIDEHPSIAGQLGVQSIPAVFAFVGGQPVDGFMGALPEGEVKAFIDRLVAMAGGGGEAGGDPVAEALDQARAMLEAGDASGAAQLFAAVLQHEPENGPATAGLAECFLDAGDPARAKALVDALPAEANEDKALAAVRTRLKLLDEIAKLGDPVSLAGRLQANPDDHQARYDLALIAQAQGNRDEAATQLLEIVRRDRAWNEDGARRKLLEFFDAWGPTDPATKEARRRLSSLLFS